MKHFLFVSYIFQDGEEELNDAMDTADQTVDATEEEFFSLDDVVTGAENVGDSAFEGELFCLYGACCQTSVS